MMRRIRGAIGMGLVWAVAWSAVGAMPRWVFGVNADAPFPLIFGVLGFVTGVAFSGLLALGERRRNFSELSMASFAGWGAVSGIALAALFARAVSLGLGDLLAVVPTFAIAGAVSAAGSLAIARRAVQHRLGAGAHAVGLEDYDRPRLGESDD
jgi:hypothetical protein